MSSKRIRDILIPAVETFLNPVPLVDITGRFEDLNDYLEDVESIDEDTAWVAIDFVANPETPITIPAHNALGKFRETGLMILHVVEPASNDQSMVDNILARAEALQNFLRGENFSGILIENITPPNFQAGTTLTFDGGWTAAAITASFESDLNL